MEENVKRLLDAHNIDLEQESVIFALQDCAIIVNHNYDDDTMVTEVYTTDNVIAVPLEFADVIK